MAIDDIHELVERLLRIVLTQLREHIIAVLRLAAHDETHDRIGELVVHHGVHRIAHEELRAILPDLAEQQRLIAILRLDGLHLVADIRPESRRNLLRDIDTPAGEAVVEPLHDDALFAVTAIEQIVAEIRMLRRRCRVAREILVAERREVRAALPAMVVVLRPHLVRHLDILDIEPVLPMPRAEHLTLSLELLLRLGLRLRLRELLRVHEIVDLAPVLIRTDRLILAIAVEIDGVVTDMVVHAIHDEMHAALLHLRGKLREIVKIAEERIDRAVVTRIVVMVRRRRVDRVQIDRRDAKLLQIVELLRDAGEIAAEEIVAIPLVTVRRAGVRVRRQRRPGAVLHRLRAACRRARIVVRLVAVEETIREDLAADSFLRPIRRLIALLEASDLEILRARELELARAARLRIVAVLLRIVEHELIPIDTIALRRERHLPDIRAILFADLRHLVVRRRARLIVRVVLVAAPRRHGSLRHHELRRRDIAGRRLDLQRDRRALGDSAPRAAHLRAPAVMDDLVRADAAVVRDDALVRRVIVERHRTRLRDVDGLRDRRLACLRDRRRIVADRHLRIRLIEIRQHEIVHRAVLDARDTGDHRQLLFREHLVAMAFRDAVRLVVVVERDRLRLVERHRDIRAVSDAAEAVVLRPGAVDCDLVVVRAGGHVLDRERIETMIACRHLRRHIRRRPLRARPAERLQIAAEHDIALVRELRLLRILALVVVRDHMRLLIVGERHLMIRREAQRDVAAVRLAVLAVVQIPRAADSHLEIIIALLDEARDDAMAVAVGLHDRLRIGGIPVLRSTERHLHRADEHDVILLHRTRRTRRLGLLRGSGRGRRLALERRRRLMRHAVIGERHLGILRQRELHIRTVRGAVRAVVLVPRAADGDLVLVVALLELALELVLALADRLHLRLAVRGRPIRPGAELRLHRADEHDILRADRLTGLRDRRGEYLRYD